MESADDGSDDVRIDSSAKGEDDDVTKKPQRAGVRRAVDAVRPDVCGASPEKKKSRADSADEEAPLGGAESSNLMNEASPPRAGQRRPGITARGGSYSESPEYKRQRDDDPEDMGSGDGQ